MPIEISDRSKSEMSARDIMGTDRQEYTTRLEKENRKFSEIAEGQRIETGNPIPKDQIPKHQTPQGAQDILETPKELVSMRGDPLNTIEREINELDRKLQSLQKQESVEKENTTKALRRVDLGRAETMAFDKGHTDTICRPKDRRIFESADLGSGTGVRRELRFEEPSRYDKVYYEVKPRSTEYYRDYTETGIFTPYPRMDQHAVTDYERRRQQEYEMILQQREVAQKHFSRQESLRERMTNPKTVYENRLQYPETEVYSANLRPVSEYDNGSKYSKVGEKGMDIEETRENQMGVKSDIYIQPVDSHKQILEHRNSREAYIRSKEEEIIRKQLELNRREARIQQIEQMVREKRLDPLEAIYYEKERALQETLQKLHLREKEIGRREDALKAVIDPAMGSGATKNSSKLQTKELDIETDKKYSQLTLDANKEGKEKETKQVNAEETERLHPEKQFLFPKFSVFSGEDPKPKAEATFEEWKYEVNCTVQENIHSEQSIAQAIRKSLRGQAKRVLLPMGTSAPVEKIISRLEGVFGNVASGESVLQEFYTATQKVDESVATWGLRLEEILQKAIVKGHVKLEEKNDMLRTKFWRSLRSDRLKNATRVHFESITNFEMLRRAVREEEHEIKISTGIQHQATTTKCSTDINTGQDEERMKLLLDKITSLEAQVKELNQRRKPWWQTKPQSKEQTASKNTEAKEVLRNTPLN